MSEQLRPTEPTDVDPAIFREELLGLTGADEEEDKFTLDDVHHFLGTETEKEPKEPVKDEDDIHSAERN